MVRVWSVYGLCMVRVWSVYGLCMVIGWSVYGRWSEYGPSIVYFAGVVAFIEDACKKDMASQPPMT